MLCLHPFLINTEYALHGQEDSLVMITKEGYNQKK